MRRQPSERARNTTKPNKKRPGRPTLSNEELLDRALELFLELGFERTSIDAITAAAGMAKRTVYARYRDKDTLFRAALERAIEDWIVPTETLRAAETDDLEETLLNIGRILVGNVLTPAGMRLLRITNAESNRMPEIGTFTWRQGTERTLDYLADLLRRRVGSEVGVTEDWPEAANAFIYLVVAGPPTMTAWGMHIDDATIDSRTNYGVRLFLHGLLPRKQKPKQVDRGASQPVLERLHKLEDENMRLKQLLAETMLEVSSLRNRGQP